MRRGERRDREQQGSCKSRSQGAQFHDGSPVNVVTRSL
jgi:hypothetical protein